MMARWRYRTDQEDPAYVVTWLDRNGSPIDFSTGYTFTLKLVSATTGTTGLTKTSGITGAATAPNISVAWSANELASLSGDYIPHLTATTGGRDRVMPDPAADIIEVYAAPT
jgi:hypothetical protein